MGSSFNCLAAVDPWWGTLRPLLEHEEDQVRELVYMSDCLPDKYVALFIPCTWRCNVAAITAFQQAVEAITFSHIQVNPKARLKP